MKAFGDVISFSTIFLTSKYDMLFAPFVSVNHHEQSILFGCGLLLKEDSKTYVRLFKLGVHVKEGPRGDNLRPMHVY